MTVGTVVNGQYNITRISKCWGHIIKYLDTLLKASLKGSLELQKTENCTAVAITELIEATR